MKHLIKRFKKKLYHIFDLNEILEHQKEDILYQNFLYPINETMEEDVFIVGYPKSGNTWMQSLMAGLIYGIDTQYLSDKLAQEIVPDVHARSFYHRFGQINFFKSHYLPQQHYKSVIYLVRDARDVMVSYYHYNQNVGKYNSLEQMVYEEKGIPCAWQKHVKQWLLNPYNSNIMYVRYEDLLDNPVETLAKVCEFVNLDRNISTIKKVIKGNSIEKMREKSKKYNGMGHRKWEGMKAQKFFRNGKTGAYKEEMPNEIIQYINASARYELMHFGYDIK